MNTFTHIHMCVHMYTRIEIQIYANTQIHTHIYQ